jgi:hypothetical protein
MGTTLRFLDKSGDEDEPGDWECMHSVGGAFLEPECYAFAIALNRALNWPIIGLMKGDVIYHALLESPEGIVDYRGTLFTPDDPQLGAPFSMSPPYVLKVVHEEDLLATRPVLDHDISLARVSAEALWPNYPWDNPIYQRMIAFTDELEALCRTHGIWLRAAVPAQRPTLSIIEDHTDVAGYDLQIMMDGKQCQIDQRLKQ